MNGTGNCRDNSAGESFFKSLKSELVWRSNWQTRREMQVARVDSITGLYNPRRRHAALGWESPVAFERSSPPRMAKAGASSQPSLCSLP